MNNGLTERQLDRLMRTTDYFMPPAPVGA